MVWVAGIAHPWRVVRATVLPGCGTPAGLCGCRPATPLACHSTPTGPACAARTCTSRPCACGSLGWSPCRQPLGEQRCTAPSAGDLSLAHPLCRYFGCGVGAIVQVVALGAEGDHPLALLLELEKAGGALVFWGADKPGVLQRLELFTQGGLDHGLQLLGREGEVQAVRVHLHQLEVGSGHVVIQEVVVELQHGQFGNLIDHDAALEEAVYGDCLRTLFHPVHSTRNFVAPLEEGGAHVRVQLVLLAAVERLGLRLLVLDQLAVGAVAEQFEDVGKDSLAWIRISLRRRLAVTSSTNQLKMFASL